MLATCLADHQGVARSGLARSAPTRVSVWIGAARDPRAQRDTSAVAPPSCAHQGRSGRKRTRGCARREPLFPLEEHGRTLAVRRVGRLGISGGRVAFRSACSPRSPVRPRERAALSRPCSTAAGCRAPTSHALTSRIARARAARGHSAGDRRSQCAPPVRALRFAAAETDGAGAQKQRETARANAFPQALVLLARPSLPVGASRRVQTSC